MPQQKVFVCYVTSGSYSDSEWQVTHVFTNEQKAIDWVKGVEKFYNIAREKVRKGKWKHAWAYDREGSDQSQKAEIEKLKEECNLGFKLFGDWDGYLVGMYDEMVVED